jgi:hypothetical protein
MARDQRKVRIGAYTFERPFPAGATFAAVVGAPIGSWVAAVQLDGDDNTYLTVATPEVLAAFGIDPDAALTPGEDRAEALSMLPDGGDMATEYGIRRRDTGQTIWVGTDKEAAIERSWREVEVVQRLVWRGAADPLEDEEERDR